MVGGVRDVSEAGGGRLSVLEGPTSTWSTWQGEARVWQECWWAAAGGGSQIRADLRHHLQVWDFSLKALRSQSPKPYWLR